MSFQVRVHIEAISIQLNAFVFIVKSLMNNAWHSVFTKRNELMTFNQKVILFCILQRLNSLNLILKMSKTRFRANHHLTVNQPQSKSSKSKHCSSNLMMILMMKSSIQTQRTRSQYYVSKVIVVWSDRVGWYTSGSGVSLFINHICLVHFNCF